MPPKEGRIQMLAEHWEDTRLYLAVAIPSPAITQLREFMIITGTAADQA